MDTIERKKQSIRKSTVSIIFPGFVLPHELCGGFILGSSLITH